MEFSKKSREHMDQCRFCWMCRHICPIGNATGQERDTARARGMILALVARNGVEYTPDIVDNVYECALCGACVKECVTGWDPVSFTKEARLVAALNGKLPSYVEKMLENNEKQGNVYGIIEKDKELLNAVSRHSKKTDTLLFLGKTATYKTPSNAVNAIKVLEKAKVDFTVLENEPDSGYSMEFLVGAAEETRQIAIAAAKEIDFKNVVCYDSCDAMMFLREYKEWGIELKANVITFTKYIADLIADKKLVAKKDNKTYTFQDPAHLARDIEETKPARDIISAFGENKEMLLNGKDTMIAGNLIMNEYMPEVMKNVADDRWTNAINIGASIVVTADPSDYVLLSETKPENMTLVSIEEVVL